MSQSVDEYIKNDTSKKRRDLFRSIFSFIEGNTYKLKQEILIIESNRSNPKLKNEEIILLEEKNYFINNKGKVKSSPKYLNLSDNIKFVVNCYCRSYDIDSIVDYSIKEWQCLIDSIKIRNRITHPKNVDELEISNDEISTLMIGFDYYNSVLEDFLDKSIENLDKLEV